MGLGTQGGLPRLGTPPESFLEHLSSAWVRPGRVLPARGLPRPLWVLRDTVALRPVLKISPRLGR